MGTPASYLPPALSTEQVTDLITSLGLPQPDGVELLRVTAEYHSIYLVHFSVDAASKHQATAAACDPDGSATLVLRVSGKHLPGIKTLNEVAVMRWVRENTTIPIPSVVAFDASPDNGVGHEFTLLERVRGISVDKVFDALDQDAKRRLVEQLADVLAQLHAKSWNHVGGLVIDDDGVVIPGPVLEETFWQTPDIAKYWTADESVETLNISGPYGSYTEYIAAHMNRYIYAVEKHPALSWLRDLTPRLRAFIVTVRSRSEELDETKLLLAHKDLHFANVMCDPATAAITAVLDWEFSGVVPGPRWDPVGAFLWNGQRSADAYSEQREMRTMLQKVCRERGLPILEETEASQVQKDMQTVANYTRALVEVCPRGQGGNMVDAWRRVVEDNLAKFGV